MPRRDLIVPTHQDITAWRAQAEAVQNFGGVRLGEFDWPWVVLSLIAARNKDWADAELALNILTACRGDLDLLLSSVPPSKRSSGFKRAAQSLSDRIGTGEQMREERRNAQS